MNCPSCKAALETADVPKGLGGSLVRVACPACGTLLLAEVKAGAQLEVFSSEQAEAIVFARVGGNWRFTHKDISSAVGVGAAAVLVYALAAFPGGVKEGERLVSYLKMGAVALAVAAVTLVIAAVLRRRRTTHDASALLDALPHLEGALKAHP